MNRSRRRFLIASAALSQVGWLFRVSSGQSKSVVDEVIAPELDGAITKGLAYLANQQQADGSFQNRERVDGNTPVFGGPKVALTAMAVMAYLATGRMPDTGKHAAAVRGGIDHLIKAIPEDGYYGKLDGSRMYGHALATLALAESHGAESDEKQRKKSRAALEKAVKVLLTAQNMKKDEPHQGGWRYEPGSVDSDLSVTGWCVLALRAALNAGIEVPKSSADRAADFVLRCWRADQKGFSYQPKEEAMLTMTAVGLLDLQLLDRGARPEVALAAKYLIDHPPNGETEYPYYARYYTTQAAYQLGGKTWAEVWNRTQTYLLQKQEKDTGAWPQSRTEAEPGHTYATAIALLTLAIPLRLLPAYQR